MVTAGAIVPHAPLLAIDRSPHDPMRSSIAAVLDALGSLNLGDCDTLLLLSPHGGSTGVYRSVRGSLDGFGLTGVGKQAVHDMELADDIARAWDCPILPDPADHGITASLIVGTYPDVPVVAVAFAGVTGPAPAAGIADVVDAARHFVRAVQGVQGNRRLAVVASAHTSAALSPRAPLMDRPEGHDLDARILGALEADVGDLARIEPALWEAAGSCGAAPLTALGLFFEGAHAEVLAYRAPAGVGYLVVRVEQG